jgi:hypothetical protein
MAVGSGHITTMIIAQPTKIIDDPTQALSFIDRPRNQNRKFRLPRQGRPGDVMPRNPYMINLIDKPSRNRLAYYSRRRTSSGDGVSRVFACVMILLTTVAGLWTYGLIAHRQPAYASFGARIVEHRSNAPSIPAAIAPDMNSVAVRLANADVPAELQKPEQKSEPKQETKTAKHAAAAPHRKKKTQMVARRRAPDPAIQAFAWGSPAFGSPFGGTWGAEAQTRGRAWPRS